MTVRIETAIMPLFGEVSFQQNLKYIEQPLGKTLHDYLLKDFYADHSDGRIYQWHSHPLPLSLEDGQHGKEGLFQRPCVYAPYRERHAVDAPCRLCGAYIDKIEQQKLEAEDQAARDDLSQIQRNKVAKQAAE